MIIDAHAHIIVPEITRPAGAVGWQPHVSWEGGRQIVDFAGKRIHAAVHEFVHIEAILETLAARGTERAVLCPWVPLLHYDAPAEEGLRTSRIQNAALARLAQAYPTQVYGLGTVPLQDPELAARELESVMQEPGLYGVEVTASVGGIYLGDDRFRPFWSQAEALQALVFIHPTTRGFNAPVFNEYYLWNTVGNPLETTITAAHMISAGVMEAHPKLKVLLAHGGGTLLALRGRLRHASNFQPQASARLTESLDVSLKRFYYDSLTHDSEILRTLIEYVGADHVLLGSDYPFDMGDDQPAEAVRALQLPAEAEAKILGGNAASLLQKLS